MQYKKTVHTDRQTDRRTHTQTHRAYKWLQIPPSNLTVNVGNDKPGYCIPEPLLELKFTESSFGVVMINDE